MKKNVIRGPIAIATVVALSAWTHGVQTSKANEGSSSHMDIKRAETLASAQGPAERFTGAVSVTQLFGATDKTRTSGGRVTFQPSARSAWHTHPAGQTLVITAGTGWVQEWGGRKQQVRAGDVIWTPPGVKHWHGATETESMTHLAIQEQVDGSAVTWMEHVTEEEYRSELAP